MKALIGAMLLLASAQAAAAASAATPCDQLAADARAVKDWSAGAEAALKPVLRLEEAQAKPSPLAAALAQRAEVKRAVGNEDGTWTSSIAQLPGAPLYLIYTVQGTLHCQTSAFVVAEPGRPPRLIKGPVGGGAEDSDLCWTQSGSLGQVHGQAAYIVHGALNDRTDDALVQVYPWTGQGWGAGCQLDLTFRPLFRLTETDCGDRTVCAQGASVATAVAAAFASNQAKRGSPPFAYGPPPAKDALAAVARAKAGLKSSVDVLAFPTFGGADANDAPGYSYGDFTVFPLTLGGRAFVGAIGHEGVGWRTGGPTLLSIFSEANGALKPLAGYIIERANGGLLSAVAGPVHRAGG